MPFLPLKVPSINRDFECPRLRRRFRRVNTVRGLIANVCAAGGLHFYHAGKPGIFIQSEAILIAFNVFRSMVQAQLKNTQLRSFLNALPNECGFRNAVARVFKLSELLD
ncbi:hypothetical protein IPJ72_02755 [Candidatus Peregrinibacteria bacterium]|nr:MAG: hypothetical protein IPJ72_02755 [Candidatus Peregrinibacteria bacterium]